ncbi:FtsX-like permease family protein [Asanoa siamensis]|uniref:ABC3 transporter permease C-terminal domain-containing protein n=1 Tax=Asanoa siamensis TaxID=926357 RepID=A0ABQ4D4C0_9ACTN|nr:FtsX-like permease family protein [Asanoa siamensis]GIF78387.1 hypothetical protein Asi02nite_79050 [Asanoa siamensis]
MLRIALAQWRVRARRSTALLSIIAIAVTGFTLLTSAAVTARLDTVGTVRANFRPAYDILVRPDAEVLPLERERDLVQSGQLAGMRGGISVEDWQAIQSLDDVAVAAPVAVIGYIMRTVPIRIDVGDQLDPDARQQVLRVQPTWVTDAGLSHIPDGPAFVYATSNVLRAKPFTELRRGERAVGPTENYPDGTRRPVCPLVPFIGESDLVDPTDASARSSLTCTGGPGSLTAMGDPTTPTLTFAWTVPFLMAAVDPVQEAALAGLDGAISTGRYFNPAEAPAERRLAGMPYPYAALPILIADRPQVDARLDIDVLRLDGGAVDLIRRNPTDSRGLRAALATRTGTPVATRSIAVEAPYREMVREMLDPSPDRRSDGAYPNSMWLEQFWTVGPAELTPDGSGLRAERTPTDRKSWGLGGDSGDVAHSVPMELADTGVRGGLAVHRNLGGPHAIGDIAMPDVTLDAVGTFDPTRVTLGSPLSAVPMDTYFNPGARGADEPSRQALGGRLLEPNANVTGLLGQPPLVLTTMAALPQIFGAGQYNTAPAYPELQLDEEAPISMVRVRLPGEVGMDALSRERVRLVAERIADVTGLRVDITLGSSPTPVTVHNPAGEFGRPALALGQPWVRKGVAAVLVQAADRKSVLLSVLVLAVCAVAILNATAAATRARRTELAVLACLGWTRRKLLRLLCTELAGIGLAAGVTGTLVTVPIALAFDLAVSWPRALLAIPIAVVLALLAGAAPAWRASRSDPGALLRPAVAARAARLHRPRRVVGLALANVARAPGRTVLGALSLAIGITALTVLLSITFAFRGAVAGTLLGEAVVLQARTVDYLAVAVTIALGVVSVADVLYLNVSERAAEFALLAAVGWPDAALARLVFVEAVVMGAVGGAVGAGAGLGAAALFAGGATGMIGLIAGAAFTVSVGVSILGVVVPVVLLRRLPTAQLLAQE